MRAIGAKLLEGRMDQVTSLACTAQQEQGTNDTCLAAGPGRGGGVSQHATHIWLVRMGPPSGAGVGLGCPSCAYKVNLQANPQVCAHPLCSCLVGRWH